MTTETNVHWTDKARRKVHPVRGAVKTKKTKLDLAKLRKQIATFSYAKPVASDQACEPLLARFTEALAGAAPADSDAYAAGAVALGLNRAGQQAGVELGKRLINLFVAEGGATFALKVLVAAAKFQSGRYSGVQMATDTDQYSLLKPWTDLRRFIATVPEDDYQNALAFAADARVSAGPLLRASISYAFPCKPQWAAEDAELLLSKKPPWGANRVLASLTDAKLATRLSELDMRRLDDILPSCVDRLGAAAAPALAGFLENSYTDHGPVYEALALIESKQAAATLATALEHRKVAVIASSYFARHPHLGADALKPLVKRKVNGAAALLHDIEKVASAKQKADDKSDVPVADNDSLPAVLRDPPWLKKKPAIAKISLEPIAIEDEIAWTGVLAEAAEAVDRTLVPDAVVEMRLQGFAKDKELVYGQIAGLPAEVALPRLWICSLSLLETVAEYGVAAIDWVAKVLDHGFHSTEHFDTILHVGSTRLALPVARYLTKKRQSRRAGRWLALYPKHAAYGLIPPSLDGPARDKKIARAAIGYLVGFGHRQMVLDAAAAYGEPALRAVEALLDQGQNWPAAKPKPLPEFYTPAVLPRPILRANKQPLDDQAMQHLGQLLRAAPTMHRSQTLDALKEACTDSISDFALGLARAWISSGASSKDGWAAIAVGHLGNDDAVQAFASASLGYSKHAAEEVRLDALALSGSLAALRCLHRYAKQKSFPAFSAKAWERLEYAGEVRGITAEALTDLLVPELDLDRSGRTKLGKGVLICFDEHLEPQLQNAKGDIVKWPKTASDELRQRWDQIKRDVRSIGPDCLERLERALRSRRRWALGDLRATYIEHALLTRLAQGVIWGVYDSDALQRTFRVCEDHSLADQNDETITLGDDCCVGIVHPLELAEADQQVWRDLLFEYQIIQPLPQLNREHWQAPQTEMQKIQTRNVSVGELFALEKLGWRRAGSSGGGRSRSFSRPVLGTNLTVQVALEPGLVLGDIHSSGEQTVTQLNVRTPLSQADLSDLHPVFASEIVYDLHRALGTRSGASTP